MDRSEIYDKIATKMGWTYSETVWWWEGGRPQLNGEDKKWEADLRAKGWNCDSDDPACWSQFFFETLHLTPEEIAVLELPAPKMKEFLCIWGDGYTNCNDRAHMEYHHLEFFTESNGFETETIDKLSEIIVGESLNVPDLTSHMSIIRTQ